MALDLDPALVDGPMVGPADKTDILHAGLTPFGPVLDVMGLQVTGPVAPRKPADSVTARKGTPERGRDLPGLATHVQNVSLFVLRSGHVRGIAGKAAARFRGNPITRLQFTKPVLGFVGKNGRIHVDHDLIGFPSVGLGESLAQGRLGDEPQGVDSALGEVPSQPRFS
jgi:hypothetical protein